MEGAQQWNPLEKLCPDPPQLEEDGGRIGLYQGGMEWAEVSWSKKSMASEIQIND